MKLHRPTPPFLALALLAALASCVTPSISQAGTRFSNAYAGELHPVEVLGSLEVDPAGAAPSLVPGQRLLLVQSGAERPDPLLIAAFEPEFELELTSGVPFGGAWSPYGVRGGEAEQGSDYGLRLQQAARSMGVDTIGLVFGRLDLEQHPTLGAVIGWIPIVGYPVPMVRTTAGIRGSLLLIDVGSGRSRQMLAEDQLGLGRTTSSMLSHEQDLIELADRVKAIAYPRLVEQALAELGP